jgi:DNA-binding transcriptional regulator YiaG
MPVTKRAMLKALNTPEPKEHVIARLLVESRGKSAEVSVGAALEFRREAYGLSADEFAFILGIQRSHYNELVNGRREISKKAMRRAFAIGVPAAVLLQPTPSSEPV